MGYVGAARGTKLVHSLMEDTVALDAVRRVNRSPTTYSACSTSGKASGA